MRRIDNKIQAGDKTLKVFDRSWLFDFSNSEGGKLHLRKSCYYLLRSKHLVDANKSTISLRIYL